MTTQEFAYESDLLDAEELESFDTEAFFEDLDEDDEDEEDFVDLAPLYVQDTANVGAISL